MGAVVNVCVCVCLLLSLSLCKHHLAPCIYTTQATDTTKKEAFRKYLESAGVIDALTKGTFLDPYERRVVVECSQDT